MSILSFLSNTFNPSESVAAARRKSVFQTESKLAPAILIPAVAAGAIIAGPVAIAGAATKIVSKAASSFSNLPLAKQVVVGTAATVVGSYVVNHPSSIAKAPSSVANFGSNLVQIGKDPSNVDNYVNLVKENPIISGVVAAAAIGGGASLGATLLSSAKNTKAIKENTAATLSGASSSIAVPAGSVSPLGVTSPAGSSVPLTPATQEVKSLTPVTKKRKYSLQNTRSSNQFKISLTNINQSHLNRRTYYGYGR